MLKKLLLALILLPGVAHAGRYPAVGAQAFTYADNTQNLGDGGVISPTGGTSYASVIGNAMKMCKTGATGNYSSFKVPDLDPGKAIQSFDASFTLKMKRASNSSIPGSGWALCFGPIPANDGLGDLGYTMANGLVISFDTFRNTTADRPSIEVYANNASIGNFLAAGLTGAPGVTSAIFTLTNPATGGATGALGNFGVSTSAATMQNHMRQVSGWNAVVVSGPNGGPWQVDHGVVGAYANPTVTAGASISPGGSAVVITNTQDGTASVNEKWEVKLDGSGFSFDDTFRAVVIHWDYSGLDITYNGQVIFTDLPTPGFAPAAGQKFAITGLNEGNGQETFFDDLTYVTTEVQPLATGGPVISEFMAENKSVLEDEDVESPDWIELYNGQNASVNLNGYKLSNGTTTWIFPSVTMPAYGYLVVYASGKNRTTNPALLHTNFTLQKEGGTVSLLNPANATVSSFTYPNQIEDVSYGLNSLGNVTGFIAPTTPGTATLYNHLVAANGPAEDVVWSREGGLITGATSVSITPPLAPGSVVRYTTDNTEPTAASTQYTAPFSVSAHTNFKARVFTPGWLPGGTSARTFLLIDSTLSNYNGSGQPFSSNIPVIVFDSFGTNVDGENGASRPLRYTAGVVIDKDPATGRAVITALADYAGRGGTHVHGESSAGFTQRLYNWETWNSEDLDKDVGILGLPAHSDWILHGPWSDESLMRNHLTFSLMRAMRTDYIASRSRQVEVFFNQDGGAIGYADYRGVYTLLEKVTRGKDRADVERLNDKVTDPLLLSGGYIFKHDKTDAGSTAFTGGGVTMQSHYPEVYTAGQLGAIQTYLNNFNAVLNGANFTDPVTGYAAWIDVSTFIDSQWAVELTKQIDGYVFSTYWHKPRGGKVRAGQIWDFNIALGNADYGQGERADGWNYDAVGANSGGVGQLWYPRLHADPVYRRATFDRYWEWRRTVLSNAAWTARVTAEAAALTDGGSASAVTNSSALSIQSPAARHYRKHPILGSYQWPNPPGSTTRTNYQHEIDYLRNWMLTRLAWLDDQFRTGTAILRPPVFSNSGGSVPAGTQLTITPYTGTPPSGFTYATGTIYYTTDGGDPAASSGGSGTETTYIAGGGGACKWLVPSAGNGGFSLTASAGAQQWTTYTDPPNIANWITSVTGVGYERDAAATYDPLIGAGSDTEAQMYGINSTCYLRVSFNIANQAALDTIGTLRLAMKYDDGYRAYINGVFVAGRNDADPSLANDPSTAQANQIHDDAVALIYEDVDVTADGKPALRIGTNVLAIHGLNFPSTSSDLIFVPKLTSFPPGSGGGGGQIYTGPLTLNSSVAVRARLFSNGTWSPLTTGEYVVNAVAASAANLVISEVMYNPLPATPGESSAGYGDNDFEYIELLNAGLGNVDLTGCNITDGVAFDFDVADADVLTLTPGQRILVVANQAAFIARYGAVPGVKIAGAFAGSLSNSGEQIIVTNAVGAIIAQFTYGTGEPWPVGADGAGFSLVLNNPAAGANYNAATNWRASAQTHGTPGAAAGSAFAGNPNGDTDGDSHSDYLEFALGSDMAANSSIHRPACGIAPFTVGVVTDKYLVFSYHRNNAADGVNYFPEISTDLIAWSTPVYVGTTQNGDGTATTIYRSGTPVGSGPRQYFRLRVAP